MSEVCSLNKASTPHDLSHSPSTTETERTGHYV